MKHFITLVGMAALVASMFSISAKADAVDTTGAAVTASTDLGDIDTDATTVGDFANVIAPDYSNVSNLAHHSVWYGTCTTSSGSATKVVTLEETGFALVTGACVAVRFTNSNSVTYPYLNVNDTGAKYIKMYGSTQPAQYMWYAGAVVTFVYDGTYWMMNMPSVASTTYRGVVVLSSSTNSTSTTGYAATPSAVRDVRRYVDTATRDLVPYDTVTNLVWEIYTTSQRYMWDAPTETCYRQILTNDFYILEAVTNVYPTAAVIKALEK